MAWLLDLDGVVWRGADPVARSADAVARLDGAGVEVFCVTNNSALTAEGYARKLADCGVTVPPERIVHGGHGVAQFVRSGMKVLVCGGSGIVEGIEENGAVAISVDDVTEWDLPHVDAVIVGWRPDYDYRMLSLATRAVLNGAQLLAPSSDPLFPTSDGVLMGGGGLTAAVAYSTGVQARFSGKPRQPIIDAIRQRVGDETIDVVVGDQPSTDGALAENLGVPFALVLSGVTPREHEPFSVPIAIEADDLFEVVDIVMSAAES